MKHFPFLIFLLLLLSCKSEPHINKPADFPPVPRLTVQTLPEPKIIDTVRITKRVEVPVMWSWQDNPTPGTEIVQPDANLSAVYSADSFPVNLSGTFGEWKISVSGFMKKAGPIVTPPDVTPNEPEDTTSGGNDPPVVFPGDDLFVGINSFPWIPLEKLTPFSTVRCYIASGWIWRPNGLFSQPMFQAETEYSHGLDDYFIRAKKLGIDVLPCVNQSPDWYNGYTQGIGSNDYPPIKKGLDRKDPKSYADYAEFWYQFCARYGSTKHPDSDLRLDETPRWSGDIKNVKKSGLGLIKAVEINNEVMRWWDKGTEKDAAYMHPEEFAAMMTAVYKACKRADPNMKVIMGGTTNFELPYLKAMAAKFDALGLPFQSDALSIHHYSSKFNEKGKHPPTWKNSSACLPSEDKDFPTIYEVVAWGKSIGLPVWVTEFGADTKPQSWMHVQIPGMTDEEAQGKLLVETYKAYKLAGVERCYAFMAADEPGNNGGLWQTSGVLRNKENGYVEKPSWHAIRTYVESLKSIK